jgi:hypothetical protein
LDENGLELTETMAFIPLWLLDRLVQFDADGDPDIETQCDDEGGDCEDEGAQCEDEGATDPDLEPDDNGAGDADGLHDVYAYAGGCGSTVSNLV